MASSLKILFVHQNAELYGSDRTFEQSIRACRNALPESRITILLPCTGPLVDLLKPLADKILINEELFVLRKTAIKQQIKNPFKLVSSFFKARTSIRHYDLTYINTIVVIDFILASRLSSKPCILHIHEIPTGLSRFLFSLLLKSSNAFLIFNSKATKNGFLLINGLKRLVICNGTKIANYVPVKKPSPLNILLIGRFNPLKGHSVLLDALSLFEENQLKSIKVRMVGGVFNKQDNFKKTIIQKTRQYNLSDTVSFFDFEKEPSRHYQWATLVIVPSVQPESFGLVAIEAMGHGRPVIGSDIGGLSEIIENGKTGYTFPAGKPEQLHRAILRYLDNPELISHHGRAAKKVFDLKYHEKKYLKEIAELIQSLTKNKR